MKTLILVTVLACCALPLVNCYSDCGSVVGSIIDVEVSGCNNEDRCILKRGSNMTINIKFKTDKATSAIKAVVHGVLLNIPMPFNLPNPDGCKDSGIQCPISKGQEYTYTASLPVLNEYPKVTVDVKWELQDEDHQDLICALIPAKLQ